VDDSSSPPTANGVEPRLDERVLQLLESNSGLLAFNGLRRALGVHPESLTRSLRRLEREGIVRRTEGGYSLREPTGRGIESDSEPKLKTIASVELPAGVSRNLAFGSLAGRWFGNLRWVGVYEHPGDPWLVWSLDDGKGRVLVRLKRRQLLVLVDDTGSSKGQPALEDAARGLLVQLVQRVHAGAKASEPDVLRPRRSEWWQNDVTEFRLDRSIWSFAS